MPVKRWADLKHKSAPEKRAEIRQWVKEESERMEALAHDLKSLRLSLGMTQEQLAEELHMSQAQISETERRDDWLLSTLRRYVEALGGELEIVANIKGKRIPLRAV
jgi:predicted transcriptional regulator